MSELDKIRAIDIISVATSLGFEPYGRGNTISSKNNVIREEKTSSIKFYKDTNTWSDFGSKDGGSPIDLVMKALNKSTSEAIKFLKDEYNIDSDKDYEIVTVPQKKYPSPDKVLAMFKATSFDDINYKEHKKHLIDIIPDYLIHEASEQDKKEFENLVRYDKVHDTCIVALPDEKGDIHTFRHRRKPNFDGEMVKWNAISGTKSNYPYCRLTTDKITLIVEGSRDFLTALMCGYSVIALPQANYQLDNTLLKDRLCVFIDDDDGKDSMVKLYDDCVSEKIWFNHKEFKKLTKCDSKDFTDYTYCFKDLKTFKDTFDNFISDTKIDVSDWKEKILKISPPLTIADIEAAENQEFLYDELLIKNNITTFVSPPNTGKSALLFGIITELLEDNKIDNVFFFDPDSSVSYIKPTLQKIVNKFGTDKFMYYNGIKNSIKDMVDVLKSLNTTPKGSGKQSLVICDGLQFFTQGTINDDTSSKEFLLGLKEVRDRFGATVSLLHHTKKNKGDDDDANYIGSQIIETITDNMIILEADGKDNIKAFIKKSRSVKKGNRYNIELDFAERVIKDISLKEDEYVSEMEEIKFNTDEETADKIQAYLIENGEQNQTDIVNKFKKSNSVKKVKDILWKHNKEKWVSFKGAKNAWIFKANKVINSEPQITTYDYDDVEMPEMF